VSRPLEDYALIGDMHTAALVSRAGSIDWLCLPRFDSAACFAALLGTEEHGRWTLAPVDGGAESTRAYDDDTLVLVTRWATRDGVARVIDFMPLRGEAPDVVRIVEGVEGVVTFRSELVLRFDYGLTPPWRRTRGDGAIEGVAGPNAVWLRTPAPLDESAEHVTHELTVRPGERVPFVLTWRESHLPAPEPVDAERALADTTRFWREWVARCSYKGEWRDSVVRSLITLKALIYHPTGGIVAAATTSLPEAIGGARNWDYRYCWLRDATFTLQALLDCGYQEEARRWRDWLLRAIAGDAGNLRVLYGLAGERLIHESELGWLPGYEGSRPVRVGNAASDQLQLDIYGEVVNGLYVAHENGLPIDPDMGPARHGVLDFLADSWREPDEGIWEVRGGRRHFVYSKLMSWVAFDRAARTAEEFGEDAGRWERLRDDVRADILAHGYDDEVGAFTMFYGTKTLDAAMLRMPSTGFLPGDDPRLVSTVDAIADRLVRDGLVLRYSAAEDLDGQVGDEATFVACSFWLVDALHLTGRTERARELFEQLLTLTNDVGLLAEEYDTADKRQLGNLPQAYSHVALVNSAHLLGGDPPSRR
jgi:GH15 family glucan-1,4-alpha-glucosidase